MMVIKTILIHVVFILFVLLTLAEGSPHPLGAVVAHDTLQIVAHQLVFVRTLQGNDGAHVGPIALDDPLGAQ